MKSFKKPAALTIALFLAAAVPVSADEPQFNRLVITEIFPRPVEGGVYEEEFIEVYNNSADTIDLEGLEISDRTRTGKLGAELLPPGQYAIVCSQSKVDYFKKHGRTVALSPWTTLNNDEDRLHIRNGAGDIIFTVSYDESWYKDYQKAEEGYSLEMIDPSNPCSGYHNWSASDDPDKATPGRRNSIYAYNPDLTPPKLAHFIAPDPHTLMLQFDEKLHPSASNTLRLTVQPDFALAAEIDAFYFDKVWATTAAPLDAGVAYQLQIGGLFDCRGNPMEDASASFRLAEAAEESDVVVNEILFNAKPGGAEFIELHNRSDKTINLKDWKVSVSKTAGEGVPIFTEHRALLPGDYIALTKDADALRADFPSGAYDNFIQVKHLPALLNSYGHIIIADSSLQVIDSAYYSEGMHSALLSDKQGVSLERLSPGRPSDEPDNWHSAAAGQGFATPGYPNSQFDDGAAEPVGIRVAPKAFSPYDGGRNRHATVYLELDRPGYAAKVEVYARDGRLVKKLARNEIVGKKGSFQWDGFTEKGDAAGPGYYIVFVEVFDLRGNTMQFKDKVAVAPYP